MDEGSDRLCIAARHPFPKGGMRRDSKQNEIPVGVAFGNATIVKNVSILYVFHLVSFSSIGILGDLGDLGLLRHIRYHGYYSNREVLLLQDIPYIVLRMYSIVLQNTKFYTRLLAIAKS